MHKLLQTYNLFLLISDFAEFCILNFMYAFLLNKSTMLSLLFYFLLEIKIILRPFFSTTLHNFW